MTYKVIKNFTDKNTTNLLYKHCILIDQRLQYLEGNHKGKYDQNIYGTYDDSQVPGAFSKYSESIFDSLLVEKKDLVEKIVGHKIFPSYSYTRVYKKSTELKKHLDRKSCEITISLCLGYEGPSWPLNLETKTGTESIILEPGDALWYRGDEMQHWRDPFKGDLQAQVFLHYVTQEQDEYDGRATLGLPNKYKR